MKNQLKITKIDKQNIDCIMTDEDFLQSIKSGLTTKEICIKFNISDSSVYRRAKKLNIKLNPSKVVMTDEDFLNCVNSGLTINEIKDKFGYSRRDNIVERAKKLNVYDQLKSLEPNKPNKKNKYDHNLIAEKIKDGYTYEQLIQEFGCGKSTIQEVSKEFNLKVTKKRKNSSN